MNKIVMDGNYILHKNFHVFKHLSRGELKTGTLYGFSREIHSLKKRFNLPILVTWDSRSFRKDLFDGYKGTRKSNESGNPYENIEYIHQYLDMIGIPQYKVDGYESDDLVWTLSRNGGIVYSKDRDLLQCLGDDVHVLFKSSEELVGKDWFEKEYGFPFSREAYLFYRSVVGDSSDNIKGIYRFPKKELRSYLCGHPISAKAQKMIDENADVIKKNLDLLTLVNVPNLEKIKVKYIIESSSWLDKTGVML